MKKLCIALLLPIVAVQLAAQAVVQPANPQAGAAIELRFDAKTSPLLQEKDVQLQVLGYSFKEGAFLDANLKKSGESWIATIPLSEKVLAITYALKAGERFDNNNGAGYFVQICDAKGNPLPESQVAKAILYRDLGGALELDRAPAAALPWMEAGIQQQPELARKYLPSYINLILAAQRGEDGKTRVRALLEKTAADAAATETDLMTVMNAYQRLGDNDKANALKEKLRAQFPKGLQAKADQQQAIRNEVDLAKREEMITKFAKDFPAQDEADKRGLDQLWTSLAQAHAEKKDWERMQRIARLLRNPAKASFLNNISWEMAEKGEDLNIAESYAAEAAMRAKQEIDTPSETRPAMQTQQDWLRMRRFSYGSYTDTYAYTLDKRGKTAEAIAQAKIAVEYTERENTEINERYCQYLERAQSTDLIPTLEDFISQGLSTKAMREQFLKTYGAANSSDRAQARLTELEQKADARALAELKSKMIDKPAPDFELLNLQGERVSLSSLKGKVVVADFWATWCGPCKASFPGMQQAVDQYKNNPQVAFVFINCWERGDDKAKLAGEFINSKNYNFNVLMDTEDKVVSAFGVSGIPTKFILDPNGRIRFKSVGYGGDPDALAKELSAMITLCK